MVKVSISLQLQRGESVGILVTNKSILQNGIFPVVAIFPHTESRSENKGHNKIMHLAVNGSSK